MHEGPPTPAARPAISRHFFTSTGQATVYHTRDADARWHPFALPVPHGYDQDATLALAPTTAGTVLMQHQDRANAMVSCRTHNGCGT